MAKTYDKYYKSKNEIIKDFIDFQEAQIKKEQKEQAERKEKLLKNIVNEPAYSKLKTSEEKQKYTDDRQQIIEKAVKKAVEKVEDRTDNVRRHLLFMFEYFYIGRNINYSDESSFEMEKTKGMFVGFKIYKNRSNPYVPSAIKACFAFAGSLKYVEFPLSGEFGIKVQAIMGGSRYLNGLGGLGSVSVNEKDGRIYVHSDYHPVWIKKARNLGGRWDSYEKAWHFAESEKEAVKSAMVEVFGTDGSEDEGAKVDIEVYLDEFTPDQSIFFAGRQLLHTWGGRNASIKFGEGVIVLQGDLETAGSYKNPYISWDSGTVLKVKDVPEAILSSLDSAKFSIFTGRTQAKKSESTTEVVEETEKKNIYLEKWDELTKESTKSRVNRYLVTDNILQAYSSYEGRLVSYTKEGGGESKGIMMPENWQPKDSVKAQVLVPISKAKRPIKSLTEGRMVNSTEFFSIMRAKDEYRLYTEASQKKGGRYYTDADILALISNKNGFYKTSDQMVAEIELEKIEKLIDVLQANHNMVVSVSQAVFSQYIATDYDKGEVEDKPKQNTELIELEAKYLKIA